MEDTPGGRTGKRGNQTGNEALLPTCEYARGKAWVLANFCTMDPDGLKAQVIAAQGKHRAALGLGRQLE